ncbi:MAG TPA: hypothetical protein VGD41_18110 [Pyrinomonadaceae bacterium]
MLWFKRLLFVKALIQSTVGDQPRDSPQKFVANLWTEFAALDREALVTNWNKPQNPNKLVVAATFEMAKTELFADPVIWD